MPELIRSRDCIIMFKGDAYPVSISPAMATAGWQGGQGVMWAESSDDTMVVSISDGLYAGFALWGSDEDSDRFTSMTKNQPTYGFCIIGAGGWLISTTAFEQYTYLSRVGGGPLVPITYHESDRLVFSNQGKWTVEDEFSLSGDPRAPNNYYIGFVAQAPSPETKGFMTIQTSI